MTKFVLGLSMATPVLVSLGRLFSIHVLLEVSSTTQRSLPRVVHDVERTTPGAYDAWVRATDPSEHQAFGLEAAGLASWDHGEIPLRTVVFPAQISTNLPSFAAEDPGNWEHLVEFARLADGAGFDRLVISDHVVFGEHLDAYSDPKIGGSRGGRQPTGPDGAWLEPLTTIAHLTAVTSRVRFATNILIAALRRPVVLAKMAATIDVLSGGRLDLGVGVGWQREEYEAAGLSFESRGRLLNHSIEVCQRLWRDEAAAFDGDGLVFDRIHQMPKPRQEGGVPIWVSGTVNRHAMERLALYGQGWIPWGEDAADVVVGIDKMRKAMEDRARDPHDIKVVGSIRAIRDDEGRVDLERTLAPVPPLREAGVSDFRFPVVPATSDEPLVEAMGRTVARFRELVR